MKKRRWFNKRKNRAPRAHLIVATRATTPSNRSLDSLKANSSSHYLVDHLFECTPRACTTTPIRISLEPLKEEPRLRFYRLVLRDRLTCRPSPWVFLSLYLELDLNHPLELVALGSSPSRPFKLVASQITPSSSFCRPPQACHLAVVASNQLFPSLQPL